MFAMNMARKAFTLIRLLLMRDVAQNQQLLGRMASWQVRSQKVISSLQQVEFKVTSQWGEDGIIDWLIERANIPPLAHSFVEFGVADYREANTRFLMQNRNWRGCIMDGSSAMMTTIRRDGLAWKYDLTARPAFITRENINSLIASCGFEGEVGLLSVDIDGNDYWVWEAIDIIHPILVICEYNAVFGDVYPISIPYNPQFDRTKAHYSRLYFGASINALRLLAARKGYRIAGTNLAANDAFFVREDYASQFLDGSLLHIQTHPSRFRESRNEQGQINHLSGVERWKAISKLPVVNVETGKVVKLGDLENPYSKEWLGAMTGKPE